MPTAELARLLQPEAPAAETAAPGLPSNLPAMAPPLYNPMTMMHNHLGGPAPGMPSTMQAGMGMMGVNPMFMPPAPGMMPAAPGMMMPPAPGMMPLCAAWVRFERHGHTDGAGDADAHGRNEPATVRRHEG